jgi:glutathione S-transferase
MDAVQIIGRSSSHYTRLPRIFAHELGVPLELVPIYDITSSQAETFAGNAALKLPILRRGGSQVFGSENICRAIAEMGSKRRLVWPEELTRDVSRNAQETVWNAMAAQVQLIFGVVINKLPAQNTYFVKARAGLEGALGWLNDHWAEARQALPPTRDLSFFEASLFCLVQHVRFRETAPLGPYPVLTRFEQEFGERSSAKATEYRFDPPPAA